MAMEKEPTAHWIKKMRSVFRPWNVQAGSKGYVTLEDFKNRAGISLEKFPQMGDQKTALERVHRHWIDHCNCGVEMPEGYRLTEEQYIQNVWWKIHQPSFENDLKEAAMTFMKGVDQEDKGYFTAEEAHQINSKLGREHPKMKDIFEALDEEKTGRVTYEQSLKAQKFFFFDMKDEEHPFNYIYGPLVD
jgi:Ca2+-binding EF-hand superfamily protein